MRLGNKVAIVTGATQGIGLACVQRLIAEGARVMMTDIKPEGADAANALGEAARFFAADVSQKTDVDAMVAATMQAFGRIDILINNAGVTHAADFLDLSEEDFDRVIRINLKSMFLCGQAVARRARPTLSPELLRPAWKSAATPPRPGSPPGSAETAPWGVGMCSAV